MAEAEKFQKQYSWMDDNEVSRGPRLRVLINVWRIKRGSPKTCRSAIQYDGGNWMAARITLRQRPGDLIMTLRADWISLFETTAPQKNNNNWD